MDMADLTLRTPLSQIQGSPAPPHGPPTFLTLPQEIRNKIYEYATVFPETAELFEVNRKLKRDLDAFQDTKTFITNCIRRPVKPFARLAAVNRQIRGEILHIGMGAFKARELECAAMLREMQRVMRETALLQVYWLDVYKIM